MCKTAAATTPLRSLSPARSQGEARRKCMPRRSCSLEAQQAWTCNQELLPLAVSRDVEELWALLDPATTTPHQPLKPSAAAAAATPAAARDTSSAAAASATPLTTPPAGQPVLPELPRAREAVMRVRAWRPAPSRFQREATALAAAAPALPAAT